MKLLACLFLTGCAIHPPQSYPLDTIVLPEQKHGHDTLNRMSDEPNQWRKL